MKIEVSMKEFAAAEINDTPLARFKKQNHPLADNPAYTLDNIIHDRAGIYSNEVGKHLRWVIDQWNQDPANEPHVFELNEHQIQICCALATGSVSLDEINVAKALEKQLENPNEMRAFIAGLVGEGVKYAYLTYHRERKKVPQPVYEFHGRAPYHWPDGWYHRIEDTPDGFELVQSAGESKLKFKAKNLISASEPVLPGEYHEFLRRMKYISPNPKSHYEGHFVSSLASLNSTKDLIEITSVCFPASVSQYRKGQDHSGDPANTPGGRPGIYVDSKTPTMDERRQKMADAYIKYREDRLGRTLKLEGARSASIAANSKDPRKVLNRLATQDGPYKALFEGVDPESVKELLNSMEYKEPKEKR
jgi:hypothetical protein